MHQSGLPSTTRPEGHLEEIMQNAKETEAKHSVLAGIFYDKH